MRKLILVLFAVFICYNMNAQFIKEKAINVSIGFGYAFPFEDVEVNGVGGYASGEYILKIKSWLDLKPYVGLIFTKSELTDKYNSEDAFNSNPNIPKESDLKLSTNALLLGGKIRIKAPIPYFAPYFEIGIGTSIGSFKNVTYLNNIIDKNGVILHIPIAFGVELGKKHNFDIGFSYYLQPSVRQTVGAAAIGLKIPIN